VAEQSLRSSRVSDAQICLCIFIKIGDCDQGLQTAHHELGPSERAVAISQKYIQAQIT